MLWHCNFIIDTLIHVYATNKENRNYLKKTHSLEINVLPTKHYKIKKSMFFQNKGKYNIINPRAGILAILKS